MRHNKNFNHLGRKAGHRKALMSNMASSLILHKRIETTLAKAKALRQFVEPLVTKSKEDTTHSRRIVFSYLKQKEAVTELFRTIAPKIAERPADIRVSSRRVSVWATRPICASSSWWISTRLIPSARWLTPLRRNPRRAVRASPQPQNGRGRGCDGRGGRPERSRQKPPRSPRRKPLLLPSPQGRQGSRS